MKKPIVSIVIRTLNESRTLDKLLTAIKSQEGIDLSRVEIIVVDNDSSDNTKEIAKRYGARVINISKKEFSYPKSMNLGVGAANAPIVILTVGHALPKGKYWLASIVPYFLDSKVAGVYSPVLPNKNSGLYEGLAYRWWYLTKTFINPKYINKYNGEDFGATNAALRKSLWEKHNFDQRYELGGEDTHWAEWALAQGYVIVQDKKFAVYHSHGLSMIRFIKQMNYWKSFSHPSKFSRDVLWYRKDIKW